jgi:[acyl-carrier-protein] S-malonyltransferase
MSEKLSVLVSPGQNCARKDLDALATAIPEVRETYDHADEIALQFFGPEMINGKSLSAWSREATETELATNTIIAQPLVVATTIGLIKYLIKREKYTTAYGHSIGELPAWFAADCIEEEDALGLSMLRGLYSFEADQQRSGIMAAMINIPGDIMAKLHLGEEHEVVMSTENSPDQFTLSGPEKKVRSIVQQVNQHVLEAYGDFRKMTKEQKAQLPRAVILRIGGGFHSFMMTAAAKEYRKALDAVLIRPPSRMNLFSNHSHDYEGDPIKLRNHQELQLTSPVHFWRDMGKLILHGHLRIVEAGPGATLTEILQVQQDKGRLPENVELIAAEPAILQQAASPLYKTVILPL